MGVGSSSVGQEGQTNQSNAKFIVARWRKCVLYLIYTMLALGFMNDVARADYTTSISVIGLIAVWFRKRSPCYLVFFILLLT
jgi:hypothetical protein